MEASMEIGIGPFSKSFTTHNYLSENSCIELNLIDGPFKSFNGVISEIKDERVMVEVKIFGRNNKVELTLSQIEKV